MPQKGRGSIAQWNPAVRPAQAGCWSAAGNASLIPLQLVFFSPAIIHVPLSAYFLSQCTSKEGGVALRQKHPCPQPPLRQHPPSWQWGSGSGIRHLCHSPIPCRNTQKCSSWNICLHHRMPGSMDVSGLQSTTPNAASSRSGRRTVRRSPSTASTGHPPPEPLAWDTSEGTTREIDPSRDTAWHPWPAAWGHAGQTQTRVVTALPGVHSVAARPGKEGVPK